MESIHAETQVTSCQCYAIMQVQSTKVASTLIVLHEERWDCYTHHDIA